MPQKNQDPNLAGKKIVYVNSLLKITLKPSIRHKVYMCFYKVFVEAVAVF